MTYQELVHFNALVGSWSVRHLQFNSHQQVPGQGYGLRMHASALVRNYRHIYMMCTRNFPRSKIWNIGSTIRLYTTMLDIGLQLASSPDVQHACSLKDLSLSMAVAE